MKLDVIVWHPDLSDIMHLIENKLERGDDEAYAYNVSRWQRLVDSLVHQSLLGINRKIRKKIQQVSSAIFCLFLVSTLIYSRYQAIGIALDVITFMIAVLTYHFLRRRQNELHRFLIEQQQTFELRAKEFRQAYQASVADRDRYE